MDTIHTVKLNDLSPAKLPMARGLVETLNAKIKKLGIEGEATMDFNIRTAYYDMEGNPCAAYKVMDVEFTYPTLKLDGSIKVLACIESNGGFNLVTSFDGKSRDKEFLNTKLDCDHCGYNRTRYTTYLVEHEGVTKQIGKTCFNEYSGMSNGLGALTRYRKFSDEMDDLLGAFRTFIPSHYNIQEVVMAVVANMSPDKDVVYIGTERTLGGIKGARKPASEKHPIVAGVMAQLNEFADKLKNGGELDDFQTKVAVMAVSGVPTSRGSHMKACIGMVRWFVGKMGDKLESEAKAERFKGLPSSSYVCSEGDAIKVNALILKGWTEFREGFGYYDRGEWHAKMYLRDVETGNIFFTSVTSNNAVKHGMAAEKTQNDIAAEFAAEGRDPSYIPPLESGEVLTFTDEVVEFVATVKGHFTNKSGEKVTKLNRVRNVPTTKASLKKIKEQEVC